MSSPAGLRVIAADEVSGIASVGDYAVNVQFRADRMTVLPPEALVPTADAAGPGGLINVPSRAGSFVGREAELAPLDATLGRNAGAHVIHGLGGIGKSTLAARWAAAHAMERSVTWWITADSPAGLDAGLSGLGAALWPALAAILPAGTLREQAVQWLAGDQDWLVILDNVTDPGDVASLLARTPLGRYLITSRRATGWQDIAVPVRLGLLTQPEATDLLRQVIDRDGLEESDEISTVCEELGYLPLAIKQAGAYIAETGITAREYRRLLETYPAQMYRSAAESSDADRTIARLWHVTLDRLAGDPLAAEVLRILAWYAAEDIPRTLLDGLAEPPSLARVTGRLAAYSMITLDPGSGTIAVHRLLQATARTPEPGDKHRSPGDINRALQLATTQLAAALPDLADPASWPRWRRLLLPQVDALASHADARTDTAATVTVLNRAALFRLGEGQVAAAIDYLHRALAASRRLLGHDHPSTLTLQNNLADSYERAGNLDQAIPLHEQTLADRHRILGSHHPQTLESRNGLAGVYKTAGKLSRAIPLYERVLADRERKLGSDHPDVIISRHNLAGAYEAAGQVDRAVPLLERARADAARTLGSDHPLTLATHDSLGRAYLAAGDLGRAIPMLEQTAADRQRILGRHHPQTLGTQHNLAGAYQAAGNRDRAIALFEQILADRRRTLGNHHPQTLMSQDILAGAYESAGDPARAIPLYEQTLTDRRRVLGSNHPQTLETQNNLAYTYKAAGNLDRAIPLYEQTLADRLRILGHEHPDTVISLINLAAAHEASGELDQAIDLLARLSTDLRSLSDPGGESTDLG